LVSISGRSASPLRPPEDGLGEQEHDRHGRRKPATAYGGVGAQGEDWSDNGNSSRATIDVIPQFGDIEGADPSMLAVNVVPEALMR
jgi:hypothetical protein